MRERLEGLRMISNHSRNYDGTVDVEQYFKVRRNGTFVQLQLYFLKD